MTENVSQHDPEGDHRRWQLLRDLEAWLDGPMLVLSFLWLMLVFVELVWSGGGFLEAFGTAIWGLFIAEFLLRFLLAPTKFAFLRRNWLTVIALFVPALRLFRMFRVLQLARAARGFRLVRIIGTANRG